MHPTSKIVVKAMIKAKKDGIEDVEYKVYKANYEKFYDVYTQTDPLIAIDAFNKIMGTKYTLKDIDTKEIQDELNEYIKYGQEVNIEATPSFIFPAVFETKSENCDAFSAPKL
jgi:hypothetical protein